MRKDDVGVAMRLYLDFLFVENFAQNPAFHVISPERFLIVVWVRVHSFNACVCASAHDRTKVYRERTPNQRCIFVYQISSSITLNSRQKWILGRFILEVENDRAIEGEKRQRCPSTGTIWSARGANHFHGLWFKYVRLNTGAFAIIK